MKILIVEDETAAYENLKNMLEEIDSSIQIAGHTESVTQTARWLGKNPSPDLICMDIHLSDGSAFNLFSTITVETPVIFITAYNEYAIEAFKVNSIDYLLKPVEMQELKRALDKFRKLAYKEEFYPAQPAFTGIFPDKMLILVKSKLIPLNICEVSYFYGTNGNTRAVLKDNTCYHFIKALDAIYRSLNPSLFFRANKQFIVAKDSIKNLTSWFDNRLLVTLNTEVPERLYVSKNRAAYFKKWLIQW